MPEAELICVEGRLYVRTYATLSTPEVVMCDYDLAPRMSWVDWAWGSANPDPLPIALRRTRYPGEFEEVNPLRRFPRTFTIDSTVKNVRHEIVPVPCPKVRAGTETRWEGCRGYWQKWTKREGWVAI